LPVRPNHRKPLPGERPNRQCHESRGHGDTAGGKITRRTTERRAEPKTREGGTEQKQHGNEAPHPRRALRVDPIKEKPIAVKYVEVDDCWEENQSDEQRVGEKGLGSPDPLTAVANLVTARIGGQSSRGDGDKQQEK